MPLEFKILMAVTIVIMIAIPLVFIFVLLRILLKGDFNFPVLILRFILFLLILHLTIIL